MSQNFILEYVTVVEAIAIHVLLFLWSCIFCETYDWWWMIELAIHEEFAYSLEQNISYLLHFSKTNINRQRSRFNFFSSKVLLLHFSVKILRNRFGFL
jgi:hypothetical protein